jgi:hypothetical protein
VVLVDTSVWVDHFRVASGSLASLLEMDEVAMHPFVLGELACGNVANRKEIIALLHALPPVNKVEDDEILLFMERHALMGRGVGLIDVHLLASCHLDGCRLWTKDKRLQIIATEMKIGFS